MALNTAKSTVTLRDLTMTFDKAVKSAMPFYPQICTTVPSDGADEKYGWLGSAPVVREWVGDRKFEQLRAATYEITNKHWESSLSIERTDIDDDRLNMYMTPMEQLAAEATHHPDELWFTTLINGESSTCYDGQFFFDTDHSWGDSGTQSNDITSTVSSTSAVTVAEMKTAIRAAVKQLMGFKWDNGKFVHRPVFNRMSGLTLLVPLELRDQAYDAMESQLLGGGDSNVVIDRPNIVSSPHLTSAVKFYLFKTDVPVRPFIFQARQALRREMKGQDSIEKKDVEFMTEARYNVGYGLWENAVLTTLTT